MDQVIKPFEGLEIINLIKIREDERGVVWHGENNPQTQILTLFKRIAGSLTGGHYHKEEHPTRNPEFVLLISGDVTIYCKHMISKKEYRGKHSGPILFKYSTNVYHAMRAETDIIFLDLHDDFEGREFNVSVPELHGVLKKNN